MHEIEMHDASDEFARCWHAAGRHIQSRLQDPLRSWLKASLTPPFLEHMSFRLGNQLFFIRIEDIDGELNVPGSRQGLLAIAEGCKGHPCMMPMRQRVESWEPEGGGWGLFDLRTGAAIDPISFVTDERIEMTDWELQDFAVQVLRHELEKTGNKLMSWHGNPAVNPSIWFVGASGPEWVIVRAARSPLTKVERPANWQEIAEGCAKISKVGHFASVIVANADDRVDRSTATPASPLWRGHGLAVLFQELVAGSTMRRSPQQPNSGGPPPPVLLPDKKEATEERSPWEKRRQGRAGGDDLGPQSTVENSQQLPQRQKKPGSQPQKPNWMADEDWRDHLEELQAFERRNYRLSGAGRAAPPSKASPAKRRWSLLSYLFGSRGEGG